jgi:hypothetical protein
MFQLCFVFFLFLWNLGFFLAHQNLNKTQFQCFFWFHLFCFAMRFLVSKIHILKKMKMKMKIKIHSLHKLGLNCQNMWSIPRGTQLVLLISSALQQHLSRVSYIKKTHLFSNIQFYSLLHFSFFWCISNCYYYYFIHFPWHVMIIPPWFLDFLDY